MCALFNPASTAPALRAVNVLGLIDARVCREINTTLFQGGDFFFGRAISARPCIFQPERTFRDSGVDAVR